MPSKTDPEIGGGKKDNTRILHFKEHPFMKRISMQQSLYRSPDIPSLSWRRISYLKLEGYDGKTIQVGEIHPSDEERKSTGIISSNVIANPSMIAEHLFAYGKAAIGLVNLKRESTKIVTKFRELGNKRGEVKEISRVKEIEDNRFIAVEESDPNILDIAEELFVRMKRWAMSRIAVTRAFPNFFSLIDTSISENNHGIIFSVYRLERHLRYRIQNEVQSKSCCFDEDIFIRLKLFKVIHCLALTMEKCHRMIVNQPSMNCYSVAFLSGALTDKIVATIVLTTQLSLTILLLVSLINQTREDPNDNDIKLDSMIVTPIIAIFSSMLVGKQIVNIKSVNNAYPGMRKSLMGVFDVIANGIVGIAILTIQVILLTHQTTRFDFVINSIATIFILELDDSAVFLDDDAITDLNRRMLMDYFLKKIENIDDRFFLYRNWNEAYNFVELDSKAFKLNDIKAEYTTVEPELPENTEKLLIRLQNKSYNPSDKWEAIATSGEIAAVKMNDNAKLDIKLKWCDQCWGNNHGKLRICLIDENNDIVASEEYKCPNPRPMPATSEEIKKTVETLDAINYVIVIGHGLVSRCQKGRHYVVEKYVGASGHEMHIAEFEMKSSFCWVSGNENEVIQSECQDTIEIVKNGIQNSDSLYFNPHLNLVTQSDLAGTYLSVPGRIDATYEDNYKYNLLIGAGDYFFLMAKLKVDGNRSSAAFFINDSDFIGFDSIDNHIFTHSNSAFYKGLVQSNKGTHNDELFCFKVERKLGTIKFYINDEEVASTANYNVAISTVFWRPWRANLKIYDWTISNSSPSLFHFHQTEEGLDGDDVSYDDFSYNEISSDY